MKRNLIVLMFFVSLSFFMSAQEKVILSDQTEIMIHENGTWDYESSEVTGLEVTNSAQKTISLRNSEEDRSTLQITVWDNTIDDLEIYLLWEDLNFNQFMQTQYVIQIILDTGISKSIWTLEDDGLLKFTGNPAAFLYELTQNDRTELKIYNSEGFYRKTVFITQNLFHYLKQHEQLYASLASRHSYTSNTIKIGVAGAHSGDLAYYGIPTIKAVELAIAEVNTKGGLLGKQIELIVKDDMCKPTVASDVAYNLVVEEVIGVIGHICSGATQSALRTYKNFDLFAISPSATNPPLTQSGDYPNFFRTIAPDDSQARLQVDYALDELGFTKLAVIHDKGDYGKGLAEFARGFLEADNRADVVLYEGITPGALDYTAVINKIEASGAEAIIYGGYHPEAAKLVTQIRKSGMDVVFISDDGVKDDYLIKIAGDYAEGVYVTGPRDHTGNPIAQAAIRAHLDQYGEDPGPFFLNAYAAIQAVLNAIRVAGSTDYDSVTEALRTEWVETTLGRIRFDEKGDPIGIGFSMYQVKNGRFIEVQ